MNPNITKLKAALDNAPDGTFTLEERALALDFDYEVAEEIDLPVARVLLKAAVWTQDPNFVYSPHPGGTAADMATGCFYVPLQELKAMSPSNPLRSQKTGVMVPVSKLQTGCLIGVVLMLAGVPRAVYAESESTVDGLVTIGLSNKARRYLRVAQTVQDHGASWGDALSRAETFLLRDPNHIYS